MPRVDKSAPDRVLTRHEAHVNDYDDGTDRDMWHAWCEFCGWRSDGIEGIGNAALLKPLREEHDLINNAELDRARAS